MQVVLFYWNMITGVQDMEMETDMEGIFITIIQRIKAMTIWLRRYLQPFGTLKAINNE